METKTNIKGLPEGREYFTEIGYSQEYPWVAIRKSPSGKTITLAKVVVKPDPEWKDKLEWHAGGFAGHCSNQGQQTWLFDKIDESYTRTIRRVKSRYAGEDMMWGRRGVKYRENSAIEFYDYNF